MLMYIQRKVNLIFDTTKKNVKKKLKKCFFTTVFLHC